VLKEILGVYRSQKRKKKTKTKLLEGKKGNVKENEGLQSWLAMKRSNLFSFSFSFLKIIIITITITIKESGFLDFSSLSLNKIRFVVERSFHRKRFVELD
jgi:hypothetical protein